MATEKKEVHEYDHLLDGGKTVYHTTYPDTGIRVFATGFLYLFMLFAGLIAAGEKNKKKKK